MDSNQIGFAGDVSFKSAILTSYNGSEIEIIEMIQQVDIYEDIFSPFITVDISVQDSIGLISKTPIIGEEMITLEIVDATGKGIQKKPMFIYKVKDRVFVSDKTTSYTLCCISVEAIIDINLKISRSFKGQPSDLATNLVKDFGLQTTRPFYAEPTKNNIQFIANYWSPVQCIKFLCDRAISKDTNSATYLFFETLEGYNFISMDRLVCQDSLSEFSYSTRLGNDTKASLDRIQKIYMDTEFDYIERVKSGMYGTRMLQVNPFSKTAYSRYIDFIDNFSKFSRLNTERIGTDDATRRLNAIYLTRTSPSSAYSGMKSDGLSNWYQQRITELANRSAQIMQIDVPGRFGISVGSVSDIYIYSESPKNGDSMERDMKSLLDKVRSGRHLITAIHRIINRSDGHRMSIEVSKDSMIK